jgi:phosphate:Na+ symporter
LGLAVFLRGDERAARQLVDRKALIWRMENEAAEYYFRLPREGGSHMGQAGDVYLRILRDLKRIHSHITALAYPVLDRAGLLQNRLIEALADTAEHGGKTTLPSPDTGGKPPRTSTTVTR